MKILVATIAIGLAAVCLYPYTRPDAPWLVYNGSASLPLGFYRSISKPSLEVGDIVRIAMPKIIEPVMTRWGYVDYPTAQYLIKQIAAIPGQTVCHRGGQIDIDGTTLGPVHPVDHMGHVLPHAMPNETCEQLKPGMYFVTTPQENSMDSRYFGPVYLKDILQVLKPLWTWN